MEGGNASKHEVSLQIEGWNPPLLCAVIYVARVINCFEAWRGVPWSINDPPFVQTVQPPSGVSLVGAVIQVMTS